MLVLKLTTTTKARRHLFASLFGGRKLHEPELWCGGVGYMRTGKNVLNNRVEREYALGAYRA
jgi:hypothetical protein